MAALGPSDVITQQEIVRYSNTNLQATVPGHLVTSCLNQMSKIADDARGAGDPALTFKDDALYILDPFLLFFLKWGNFTV